MKKDNQYIVTILGHFGFNKRLLNGQTVKTKSVSAALKKVLPQNTVFEIDTSGGVWKYFYLIMAMRRALSESSNFVFLLARNGLRTLLPWILFFNEKTKKRLHFVVIGGWLPSMCRKNLHLSQLLKKVDYIYVETNDMKCKLEQQGFSNVVIMANFKELSAVRPSDVVNIGEPPYPVCTFSRVMKEKGIEDAIEAVSLLNEKSGYVKYYLDIYGQIEKKQKKWFENLMKNAPDYVSFKGRVDPDMSVSTIKNYYCLLFPTFYEGEGFAGTILDAMASGVPVIASDWKYNREIVNDCNGVLFKTRDIGALASAIEELKVSKESCLREYIKYSPSNAIKVLSERLFTINEC